MDDSNETTQSGNCCGDWRKTVDDFTSHTEKLVREDPAKAVGIALFAGVLLTILPVGRVISGLIRLAFALARPLLLVLGAVRLYEEVQKKKK
ncbi:MAG: hypothetical protein ACAI37_09350 [Chthoniobacter sp.]